MHAGEVESASRSQLTEPCVTILEMDNSGTAPKVEGAVASGGTLHRHNAAPGAANPSAAASGSSTGNDASTSALVASTPAPAHPSSVAPAPAPGSLDVATQKFKGGIGSFQALIDGLVASVAKEKEELQGSRDQLNHDKAEFEQEKARVNQVLNDNEQVRYGGVWGGLARGCLMRAATSLQWTPCWRV